jgi:hypothetical protein
MAPGVRPRRVRKDELCRYHVAAMFCTECGASLYDTAKFCSRCGAPQGIARPPQEDTQPIAQRALPPPTPAAVALPALPSALSVAAAEPPPALPPPSVRPAADWHARAAPPPAPLASVASGAAAFAYRSAAALALWVTILLLIATAIDAGSVLSNLAQANLLTQMQAGVVFSPEDLSANDSRQALFGVAQTIVYLTTTILYLCWLSRSYRNLRALSAWRLQYPSGWAVGGWFVPFLNLVRPYKIVRETWWVSAYPEQADAAGAGFTPRGNALIGFWWAAYLIMGFFGQIVFRLTLTADSPGELIAVSYVGALADLVSMLAAVLALAVVNSISSRQQVAAGRARVGVAAGLR